MATICVIGGSRYFGELLVRRLRADGHDVTVVNRGAMPPPPGVRHLVADRDDAAALAAALGSRTFVVVVDQVCYTPAQAAVAARAFRGRAGRYVMTSTIEVYDPATAAWPHTSSRTPVPETAVDPETWPVRLDLPWHDPEFRAAHYAEGKRQAEAVLARDGGLPFAAVRSAHVLGGGAREFTGRLDHYVSRILRGAEIAVHRDPLPTVFVHHQEIAALLRWAATGSDFTGALNAASHGPLDVMDLTAAIAERTGRAPRYRTVATGQDASPFSLDRHYAMDNARAGRLGFRLSHTSDWLPGAVAEALATARTAAAA
ncbi:NAD-dependent epimerase/dehydratase family protein [Streptomyces spectabilis]|uniref:NAD-dependent epimerase/dehydratase family protein n=1 Tax=Streptomyces spectabilis TaxID=68270 RepID=A0A5P2XIB7_STRST|nr:NAD-dependent epimerase/dehydratase family protein [Streptomyces spectabilis]MBB5105363.1 nucleoside-diphosphate-sugar epimerase [Streptomyces spectabilis]MCI3906556.1 NAD-dependent epimerase/dehydratase family protein [Streptomyces spectabilis]QEV63384.1 NAD-dependent epimerase/dehydratase family protein [Streptomyces spectabilis]GGV21147.1 NAD dependent epimerase/dehydratase [Streptomyces spectabilis]